MLTAIGEWGHLRLRGENNSKTKHVGNSKNPSSEGDMFRLPISYSFVGKEMGNRDSCLSNDQLSSCAEVLSTSLETEKQSPQHHSPTPSFLPPASPACPVMLFTLISS